jgi:hypothetical protein
MREEGSGERQRRGGGGTWACFAVEGGVGHDAPEGHGQPPGAQRGPRQVPGGHVRATLILLPISIFVRFLI